MAAPPAPPVPLPDLSRFWAINTFFTRDDLASLLREMSDFQRNSPIYKLEDWQIRYNLQRTVRMLAMAGEMARRERLDDGDRLAFYLAVIYSNFVTPDMNPVFHTLHNADIARAGMAKRNYTRHAALRVQRAIKEYPQDNPILVKRLANGLGEAIRGCNFHSDLYMPTLRHVMYDVLERGEGDCELMANFVGEYIRRQTGQTLGEALYGRFGRSTLAYPTPSTPEMWESEGEFFVVNSDEDRSLDKIRVYSVGTPGGRDFDFAVVNVPRLGRKHYNIGPFDIFINDSNAASAILARKTMERIYQRRPGLYQQWENDKETARMLLKQGKISEGQYNGFKARWHRERGLPWRHYAHKQGSAEEMATLPEALNNLIRPRAGGYNQLAWLLHDCHNAIFPTPDSFLEYMELFIRRGLPLHKSLTALIELGSQAIERMETDSGRDILANHVQFLRYFWNMARSTPPGQLRDFFENFVADRQHQDVKS